MSQEASYVALYQGRHEYCIFAVDISARAPELDVTCEFSSAVEFQNLSKVQTFAVRLRCKCLRVNYSLTYKNSELTTANFPQMKEFIRRMNPLSRKDIYTIKNK